MRLREVIAWCLVSFILAVGATGFGVGLYYERQETKRIQANYQKHNFSDVSCKGCHK